MLRDESSVYRRRDISPRGLVTVLNEAVPDGICSEMADRLAVAHDASHFLLTPQAVVTPTRTEQVAALMRGCQQLGVGMTFRSGGTSLSGQAVTEAILVDTRRHFGRIEVLDDGARVRVGPGATLRQVNARLAPYNRKLGPDPASESACTIGGVVANNSSGMACGTKFNSYRTLDSMILVLPSGTTIDTGQPDAAVQLRVSEPDLYAGLITLRDRICGDPSSVAAIRRQYSIKNTMGYGLNAFVDYHEPVDILSHLIIGSEGTLAFVAEVTFTTIALPSHAATALLVFDDLPTAMGHLAELAENQPATVELLDAASLHIAQKALKGSSPLHDLKIGSHAAFLVEYQDDSEISLNARVADAGRLVSAFPLAITSQFTKNAKARAELWHMRKGLYASVASARPPGTNVLLEDVAVPIEEVAGTCGDLVKLFERHGYDDNIIFGHAKDGNLHFTLNEWLTSTTAPPRYQAFTEDLVDLVLSKAGSLKAEHGTGRMMAPFVRRQFGDELYEVMVRLKQLCDPHGLLSPGVVITDDPLAHTRDFKITPVADPEVDRCVECGFCEPVCPSRNLTITPRQRIVLRREMVRAEADGDQALLEHLRHRFEYDGLSTCAADGMCQVACPVEIDTGQLVKHLRSENVSRAEEWAWEKAARNWGSVTRAGSLALAVASHAPVPVVIRSLSAARAALGPDRVPMWGSDLPSGGRRRTPRSSANPAAVYFPSCINSMFGPPDNSVGARAALVELCGRAGIELRVPEGIEDLCCATPWKSKGMRRGYKTMTESLVGTLGEATERGKLPVVCDATSCTEALARLADAHSLQVVDSVSFVRHHVLPLLTVSRRLPSITLHPTCASTRLGLNDDMIGLASEIADSVVIPDDWGCCGFAGDRGLLRPELTRAATAPEAGAVLSEDKCSGYASSNRTCELAMTRATGFTYSHLLELVNEATR